MKKVTGIGGVFFKCKDPKKMTEWYQKHLGLTTNPYGATFDWYEAEDSECYQAQHDRYGLLDNKVVSINVFGRRQPRADGIYHYQAGGQQQGA